MARLDEDLSRLSIGTYRWIRWFAVRTARGSRSAACRTSLVQTDGLTPFVECRPIRGVFFISRVSIGRPPGTEGFVLAPRAFARFSSRSAGRSVARMNENAHLNPRSNRIYIQGFSGRFITVSICLVFCQYNFLIRSANTCVNF